tara:strand:+ start:879 stop:2981 length:2103 start_codon:yes stop_codon:yes gene_type:complete
MRIRRFSEARGIFEEEVSFEPQIHCFGGGGGGGGGGSDSGGDYDEDDFADEGGFTEGFGDGGAGDQAVSDVSPGGGGDGGNDNQQDRQAYSDRFGGVSTRNFNVDTNQGFVDTDQGRVYGASDVLGKGIAEGDISPTDRQDTAIGMASDIMGVDPSNVALGGDLFFGEEDVLANQDLSFGESGLTPSTPEPQLNVTETPEYTNLLDTVNELQNTLDQKSQEYNQLQSQYDEIAPLATEIDFFKTQADSLNDQLTAKQEEITSLSTDLNNTLTDFQGLQTQFADQSEQLGGLQNQFTTAQETIAEQNARIAAQNEAAEQARVRNIAGTPTFADPTTVDFAPQQGRVVSETRLGSPTVAGTAAMEDVNMPSAVSALEAFDDFNFSRDVFGVEQPEDYQIYGLRDTVTPQAAVLTNAERMSQQGVDAEMTDIPIGATAERREIAGQDPRAPDYTLAEAQANLDAARREAYADKQFGFDTGLPGSIDVFGAKIPTGVGVIEGAVDALFNPDAALANAIAERGIRSIDGNPVPENSANYNPNGLDVVTAGGSLSEGGRTAAYDERGNIVYDSSPFSGLNPLGEGVPDNIQDLYDRQRTIDDAERERQGGDSTQAPPPTADPDPTTGECPDGYSYNSATQTCEYQGRDVVGATEYTPMGPVNISYTGLPSLAPRTLRPTAPNLDFLTRSQTAQPGTYSGLGSLRRS